MTAWHKSSFSASDSNCVEVALGAGVVGVRDSKNPGPVLVFERESWLVLTALSTVSTSDNG